ncbi:MAG: carboxymuconolactone decarboxylase family protein [Spirochaetes bacterium]|nr:carboxymuconolactone decarboxylase family protein [Spirochaetota bacterium]
MQKDIRNQSMMINKNNFKKRYIKTIKDVFKEIKKTRNCTKKIKREDTNIISPQFQEKIMLAVCGVNNCINCSYLHTKNALEAGIRDDEIKNLLNGELGEFPEQEAVALAYSQHWAESGGNPAEKARGKVIDYYGQKKTELIEAFIQLVTVGNLICNTVEAYKINPNMTGSRLKFLLANIFCLPMAKLINIRGKKGKKFLTNTGIDFSS